VVFFPGGNVFGYPERRPIALLRQYSDRPVPFEGDGDVVWAGCLDAASA
jgi:hypothetical protein